MIIPIDKKHLNECLSAIHELYLRFILIARTYTVYISINAFIFAGLTLFSYVKAKDRYCYSDRDVYGNGYSGRLGFLSFSSRPSVRNIRCFFVLLLLPIVMLFASCQQASTPVDERTTVAQSYANYKQIPGVTQDEIAAVERVISVRDSLELGAQLSSNAFYTEDDRIGGFYSLLCERFSSLFGVPFKTSIYDKGILNTRFVDGDIDFTCEFLFESDPEKSKLMVETGIQKTVLIYKKKSTGALQSGNKKDQMKRVAFLEHSLFAKDVLRFDANLEPVFVEDYADVVAQLKSGAVDAFCDYDTARINFDIYTDIASGEFLPLILSPIVISSANSDMEVFISIIGKYLENGGRQELFALYNSGKTDYNRNQLITSLSEEEKEYIESHKSSTIPFVASFDNYPICFYDETKGKYQGISIDILARIAELTGLVFEPSNERGVIWRNLLDDLENGRTAFASELLYTKERRKKFIWPDRPYTVDGYALISLIEKEDISIANIPDYRIGVITETGYTNDFDDWFPDHDKRIEYSTYAKAFDALARKEIDFVMGTKNMLLNNAHYRERTGFRANITFNYEYESAYGFHPSQQTLCNIFSKAQNRIDVDDISHRWTLRIYDYQAKLEQERARNNIRNQAIAASLFVVIVSLIIALFVRRKQNVESLNKILEETVRLRTEELERQTISAKEASMAKSDFLTRMSHEIRTPLNAIIGLSRVAKQSSDPETKAHNAIGDVISAAMHLSGILNDVLDMTKIEAGKLVLTLNPFVLKEAMNEVVTIIAESSDKKEVNFEHNVDALPPIVVEGDKMHLKQVLINLLGNAIKFTNSGGTAQLQVDCMTAAETGTVLITFTIIDNGIGISDDQLEKIYVAFEQANSSIAVDYGGIGLGLPISQKLINMMGGSITVKSQVEIGSTFAFTLALPLVADSSSEEKGGEEETIDLSCKRILIVEDMEINRIILVECLVGTSAQIDEAENGLIALNMFEQSPHGYYDLILMDIQMPQMNGYEATEKIRALNRPDAKLIPIVAITANAFQDDIDRAVKSGMNRHLAKPVDITQLMNTITEIFR